MRNRRVLGVLPAIVLIAACGGGGATASPNAPAPTAAASVGATAQPSIAAAAPTIGPGEGALNIIIWAGYAEDGSNVKAYDWVHPFEAQTGCKVNAKPADTSDEMVTLMRQGGGTQYDLVSASGDASLRLIRGGNVQPVNVNLIPG